MEEEWRIHEKVLKNLEENETRVIVIATVAIVTVIVTITMDHPHQKVLGVEKKITTKIITKKLKIERKMVAEKLEKNAQDDKYLF